MSARPIIAGVDAVTLYEYRAQVTRLGVARVPCGASVLELRGLSPLLVERSVTVTVEAVDGEPPRAGASEAEAVIAQVRIERARRARPAKRSAEAALGGGLRAPDDEQTAEAAAYGALIEAVEAGGARVLELEQELQQLEAELAAVRRVRVLTLEDIARDVSWGHADESAWDARLAQLARRGHALRAQTVEARHRLEEAKREVTRLDAALLARARNAPPREARLIMEVLAPGGVGEYRELALRIAYLVPSALWRPAHRATLDGSLDAAVAGEPAAVRMESFAYVWQRTGERWEDVEVSFSAAHSMVEVDVPTLEPEHLETRRRTQSVVLEVLGRRVESEGFPVDAAELPTEPPGLEDDGAGFFVVAPKRVTLPSDGEAHAVPLFSFETVGAFDRVLAPEFMPTAFLRSAQINRSPNPMLAGPVELAAGGGPVGRTAVGLVREAERFELVWGPDPWLRVRREVHRLDAENRTLSAWTRVPHRVALHVSNLGPQGRSVRVIERLPLSETDKVAVALEEERTSPGALTDARGFVTWDVLVPARGQRALELRYAVEKHERVIGV